MLNGHQINLGQPLNRSHPLARGVAGFWLPLSNNSGGSRLFDLAGVNHGTLTNGPTWTTGPSGFGAVTTDGSNDYLLTGTLGGLAGGSYTVAAWVRNNSTGQTNTYAINLSASSLDHAIIYGYVGNTYETFFSGAPGRLSLNSSIDSDWHLIGWSYDAGSTTITPYWDGRVGSEGAVVSSIAALGSDPTLVIGSANTTPDSPIAATFGGVVILRRDIGLDGWSALYDEFRRGCPTLLNRTRRRSFAGASGPTYTLTASAGSFTLTGNAAGLTAGRLLTAANGSFTLTGYDAGLTTSRLLTAATGSFTLTGFDTGLVVGRALTAATGAFTLTGNNAGLTVSRLLTAASGAFTLTGNDATLTYTPAGITYTLTANTGAFTLTGNDAGLTVSRVLTASAGTFTLTGNAATLTYSGASPPPAATPTGRRCATWTEPNRTATWEYPTRTARWYDDLCTC